MTRLKTLGFAAMAALTLAACNQVKFKKTKSGLAYKIFPGSGKDSLLKEGSFVKFNIITKFNDSVLYNNHGRMPGFMKVTTGPETAYNFPEIMPMLRKGDSAVVVLLVDTLLNKGMGSQLPPNAKKGDRINFYLRITEVFKDETAARANYEEEAKKDAPRQQKEQEEQMAKMQKEREEQAKKEDEELEKSGEKAKQLKVVQDYLAAKNIKATQAPLGTFVYIKEPGTGPALTKGVTASIKYTGKRLATDSTFESNTADFPIGVGGLIRGMDEGLQMFKQGGKGTIYIPGFLAYGKNPQPGSPFQPNDALIFDVEVVAIKQPGAAPQP